jgi:hypothetical protein
MYDDFMEDKRKKRYLPMVGMVVTISPNFNLYKIVVLPAASRPTIKMRISFFPKRFLKRFAKIFPILIVDFVMYRINYNANGKRIN